MAPANTLVEIALSYLFKSEFDCENIKKLLCTSKQINIIVKHNQFYINIMLCFQCNGVNLKGVDKLLAQGADISFNNWTPLVEACHTHNHQLICNLLKKANSEKINISILDILTESGNAGPLKFYLKNKTLTFEDIEKMSDIYSSINSIEIFKIYWNIITSEHNKSRDNYNEFVISILHATLISLIQNKDCKLFQYLITSKNINRYLYNYPTLGISEIIEDDREYNMHNHILNIIRTYNLCEFIEYIDIKRFDIELIGDMMVNPYGDIKNYNEIDTIIIKKFIKTYSIRDYRVIIPRLINLENINLINDIICKGYDINLLVLPALKQQKEEVLKYLITLGADRKIITDHIEETKIQNTLGFFSWEKYIEVYPTCSNGIVDTLLNNFLRERLND